MTRTVSSLSRDRPREASTMRERSRSKSRKKHQDIGPPGAGTFFVHGRVDRDTSSSRSPRRKRVSRDRACLSRKLSLSWEELAQHPYEPCRAKSPDRLLEGGIDGYTFIPESQGGVLGRGKFSTVYKVTGNDGLEYALKHTPLHPHHPLIAARLLREPTLLASLPTHPCLIGVHGSIRTPGHFYLIEQYASNHVPLSAHPTPLRPSRAAYILDQLVSVVRDCLHTGGKVVHRDLKGENILVDVDTGNVLLLDLGLGTHFSASEPKLTTCCGSPAFHSPEVVNALNHRPGDVSYYGPELDIWCIALTMLSLLLDIRFPIGTTHRSIHVMRDRVLDRLQELDEVYPPSAPWIAYCKSEDLTDEEKRLELREWKTVRKALRDFLDVNGIRRMASFESYRLGPLVVDRVEQHDRDTPAESFREVSFIPTDIKHTLPLYLESDRDSSDTIVLSNPCGLSERKILSYLKYILRSRGILYHCMSTKTHFLDITSHLDAGTMVSQLVLPFPAPQPGSSTHSPHRGQDGKKESWVSSLFTSAPKRSFSVPPQQVRQPSPAVEGKNKEQEWYLQCWAKIDVEKPAKPSGSRAPSRTPSSEAVPQVHPASPVLSLAPVSPVSPLLTIADLQPISPLTTLREGVPTDIPSARARSVDGRSSTSHDRPVMPNRTSSTSRLPRRPHPLSRQVSAESRTASRIGSHPCPTKVTITLSDPRGYGVMRKVLNVKHGAYVDSPLSASSTAFVAPSDETAVDRMDGEDGEIVQAEEEEERGRPRSKEDSKVIVMTRVTQPVQIVAPVPRTARATSRGRKIGFLEGWFGFGSGAAGARDEHARSASSPPSTTTASIPVWRA